MQTPSSAAHEINSQGSYLPLFCLTKAVDEFIVLLFESSGFTFDHPLLSVEFLQGGFVLFWGSTPRRWSRSPSKPPAPSGHGNTNLFSAANCLLTIFHSLVICLGSGESTLPSQLERDSFQWQHIMTEMMSFVCKHAHFAEMIHWSAAISRNWPL